MALGQEKLGLAIITKLRTDTGAGSLVALTGHAATSPDTWRIARDRPVKKAMAPFLGVRIGQSVPLSDQGPTHVQKARVLFRCYSTKELTAIQIADRMDHLLHARTEQIADGTNVGFYDFSDTDNVSCRQTRWKSRDEPDFDDKTDVWTVVVEADLLWVDEPCPTPP